MEVCFTIFLYACSWIFFLIKEIRKEKSGKVLEILVFSVRIRFLTCVWAQNFYFKNTSGTFNAGGRQTILWKTTKRIRYALWNKSCERKCWKLLNTFSSSIQRRPLLATWELRVLSFACQLGNPFHSINIRWEKFWVHR